MMLRQVYVLLPSGHSGWRYVDVGPRAAVPAHGVKKTLPAGGGSMATRKAGAA